MNKIQFYAAMFMTATVFLLKTIYLLGGPFVLNTIALIIICLFVPLLMYIVRKTYLVMAVFTFSFLAEFFNLIYNGKTPLTMLFYFGMHILLLVYLIKSYNRAIRLFFELPLCVIIMYFVYSYGFQNENPLYYVAMTIYSILLCVNLMLSHSTNTNIFKGMLLIFMVDTIVVWSLVHGNAELIRGICWLPFMAGEWLLADGVKNRYSELN